MKKRSVLRWKCCIKNLKNHDKKMEQNIFDYLVEGLDLNAFYFFCITGSDLGC